jgi:hypothetical protein
VRSRPPWRGTRELEAFEVVACGVDDLTIGFDMAGSRSIRRLNEMPGEERRRGKMLGDRTSWGSFANLFGRSVGFWRRETSRLYVQAKLAEDGTLCRLEDLRGAVAQLFERMAIVGVESFEPAWVTRVDVAVDAVCRPSHGKLLLDALEACRLPNGWRTRSVGVPRSTVYFFARVKDDVKARAYCRNLKTKKGEPFGRIRLEAQARYDPLDAMLEKVVEPSFGAAVWESRFGNLDGDVTRLAREVQTEEIAGRVGESRMTSAQGERMGMFLDLERLGLARAYYKASVYASRVREARRLGLAANDSGSAGLTVDVGELVRPYCEALEHCLDQQRPPTPVAGGHRAAEAAGAPAVGSAGGVEPVLFSDLS